MGRHEGPKALISERTPRQTERERRAKDRQKERRTKKKGDEESGCEGIERREEKDVSKREIKNARHTKVI